MRTVVPLYFDSEDSDGSHGFLRELAEYLSVEVVPRRPNGFVFDHWTWSEPEFNSSVYLVGLTDCERSLRATPSRAELLCWLWSCRDQIVVPNRYVGGCWSSSGVLRLSVYLAIRGQRNALRAACHAGRTRIRHPASDTWNSAAPARERAA